MHAQFSDNLLQRIRDNDPKIVSLELNGEHTEKNAFAFISALKTNTTLQSLDMDWFPIDDKSARALSEILETNTTLRSLNLDYTNISTAGACVLSAALKTNKTLQSLSLEKARITPEGVLALSETLKINTGLRSLNLAGNFIFKEGMRALSEALKTNTTLQVLDLRGNYIGFNNKSASVSDFSDALKTNKTLLFLKLGSNQIDDEGVMALSEVLKTNRGLQSLNLESNSFGHKGVSALVDALNTNTSLRNLDIHDNLSVDLSDYSILVSSINRNEILSPYLKLRGNLGLEFEKTMIATSLESIKVYLSELFEVDENTSREFGYASNILSRMLTSEEKEVDQETLDVLCTFPVIVIQNLAKLMLICVLKSLVLPMSEGLENSHQLVEKMNSTLGKNAFNVDFLTEYYRLLNGLMYLHSADGKQEALDCLLPSFEEPSLQHLAHVALSQVVSVADAKKTSDLQLITYGLKDQQTHELLAPFVFGAIWQLQYPGKNDKYGDIPTLRKEAVLLNHGELHVLAQQALAHHDITQNDKRLLEALLQKQGYHTGIIAYFAQSAAFAKEFKARYEKETFVSLEECFEVETGTQPHLIHTPLIAEQVDADIDAIDKLKAPLYSIEEKCVLIEKAMQANRELIALMENVLALKGHKPQDGKKYELLSNLKRTIEGADVNLDFILTAAKDFIMLSLQRNQWGLTNTTASGEKIKALLNTPPFSALKTLLFPEKESIKYRDLRALVCASNDVKFFSSSHKKSMYQFFEQTPLPDEDDVKGFVQQRNGSHRN